MKRTHCIGCDTYRFKAAGEMCSYCAKDTTIADQIAAKADRSFQEALDAIAEQCMADCGDTIPDHLKPIWFRRFRLIAAIEIGDTSE